MAYTLRFSPSSKCSLFHNSNVFGSCIIHILYTGCAKIKKNNSGAKRLSGVDSFRPCTNFPNNKFSGLEYSYVFCVETKNNGNFKNTNFPVLMQEFIFKLRSPDF